MNAQSRRPAPRRSSLAGSNPIAPPVAEPPSASTPHPVPSIETSAPGEPSTRTEEDSEPQPAKEPQPDHAYTSSTPVLETPAPTATDPRASAGAATSSKYAPKVSFYQDRKDTDRVRGAILHTMVSEGPRSLSQFIHQAVMAEVERLEKKYNNGEPFPPVGARELPQGRPMS